MESIRHTLICVFSLGSKIINNAKELYTKRSSRENEKTDQRTVRKQGQRLRGRTKAIQVRAKFLRSLYLKTLPQEYLEHRKQENLKNT